MGPLDFMKKTVWGEHYTGRKTPMPVERPATLIDRQKRPRMNRDQEYNACSDIYKEENPICAYCETSFAPKQLHNDHIVGGVAGRDTSLLHFDTWNTACPDCHEHRRLTLADKIIAKLLSVLRAIEWCRGQRLSDAEWAAVLEGFTRGRK